MYRYAKSQAQACLQSDLRLLWRRNTIPGKNFTVCNRHTALPGDSHVTFLKNCKMGIKKARPLHAVRTRRRAICPCYHFSSPAPRGTDLIRSVTLSAITGGTCRSLTGYGSVRCSEAIFQMPKPRFSQPVRSPAEAFSVKHSANVLSSSLLLSL